MKDQTICGGGSQREKSQNTSPKSIFLEQKQLRSCGVSFLTRLSWMTAGLLAAASCAAAGPSQEEIFKSISQNVGESSDSQVLLMFMAVGGGLIILLAIFSQRSKRVMSPKPLHHHGKLLKEVTRGLPIRPGELKQLRALAEETRGPGGEPLSSPLSLLLVPSVLAAAAKSRATKANQNVLEGLRRKIVR